MPPLWIDPRQKTQVPTQLLTHCLPLQYSQVIAGERNCGLRKGQFNRWNKSHTWKESKKGIYSLYPISREISRHFLGSRTSTRNVVASEDKCHNHEFIMFPLLPDSSYCWFQYDAVWDVPLFSWGHLSWLCRLPASCCPTTTSMWAGWVGNQEVLDYVQALICSSQDTGVLPTLF